MQTEGLQQPATIHSQLAHQQGNMNPNGKPQVTRPCRSSLTARNGKYRESNSTVPRLTYRVVEEIRTHKGNLQTSYQTHPYPTNKPSPGPRPRAFFSSCLTSSLRSRRARREGCVQATLVLSTSLGGRASPTRLGVLQPHLPGPPSSTRAQLPQTQRRC